MEFYRFFPKFCVELCLSHVFEFLSHVFEFPDSMRYFDRAALFIKACLRYEVMEANDDDVNIL